MITKLGDSHLGLSEEDYSIVRKHATAIIHAAWAVNFSMRLRSFVKDHISGLRNLLDLAIQSDQQVPPRFIFCSSTASALGPVTKSPIAECISHDPSTATPLGYSRSKWVAEAICEQAHLHTRMKGRLRVLRIGQLCGDTEHGVWNTTEAWPLMLSTVNATKALPTLEDEKLTWLPADTAAQAVLQILRSASFEQHSEIPVYHLINDNKTPTWMEMLDWMRTLNPPFEALPPMQWLERLEHLEGEYKDHPAKKLLGLWKTAYCKKSKEDNSIQGVDEVRFITNRTRQAAPLMETVGPITFDHFEKMWRWIEAEAVHTQLSGKDAEGTSVVA